MTEVNTSREDHYGQIDPLVNDGSHYSRRWWFVFCDTDDWIPVWWRHFTKHRPGFAHCFCLTELVEGITFIINPHRQLVEYATTASHPWPLIKAYREADMTVVVAELPLFGHSLLPRGPAITCASHIAYSAGVPFRGLTPYQLYKNLMKNGGIRL